MSCITLLSDFGLHDASVAKAKGVLMQYSSLPIIDISHLTEPYHLIQAAYLIKSTFRNFGPGSFHVLLFHVFSEKEPRLLLCRKDNQFFLTPDNGLLPLAFDSEIDEVWDIMELKDEKGFRKWLHTSGELIRNLQTRQPSDLKLSPGSLKNAPLNWNPVIDGNTIECHVIYIDRFENVVVNLTQEDFETLRQGRKFTIQFVRNEPIHEISQHYTDVKEGVSLCRFNSLGHLEIAINRGKAASLFGLRLHKEEYLMYNTIKIFFE